MDIIVYDNPKKKVKDWLKENRRYINEQMIVGPSGRGMELECEDDEKDDLIELIESAGFDYDIN